MIRCNLSVLLAERNLKISKVSEATKISRTTLTAISNNSGKGIQFDTINTLCNYLNITPEKLISYIPIDIIITDFTLDGESLEIDLNIVRNTKTYHCGLIGNCYATYNNDKKVEYLNINIQPYGDKLNSDDENKILIDTFSKLPVTFRNDIQNNILDKIEFAFGAELEEEYSLSFTWDNKLIWGE